MRIDKETSDKIWWRGFDAAIELVINVIDHSDCNELPMMIKEQIEEEVEIYKSED